MAKKEEKPLDPKEAKLKALQAALGKIEKDFGKGSIMRLGDDKVEKVEVIPTGSIGLDIALALWGSRRLSISEGVRKDW